MADRGLAFPFSVQDTHQCGVDCDLASTEEWETTNNDLQSEGIACKRNSHVKVSDHDIGAQSASCFAIDARHNALHGESALTQNPSPCASCSVVAKDLKETATTAAARRQRKRLTKTQQEDNAEKMRLDACQQTRSC